VDHREEEEAITTAVTKAKKAAATQAETAAATQAETAAAKSNLQSPIWRNELTIFIKIALYPSMLLV